MDNQRWWAAIIRAITSGLGLFALFALLLTLFAGAVVFSNTSEPAKLWILAVVGVFWVGNYGATVLAPLRSAQPSRGPSRPEAG